ncbi:MAG TPA: hypothetical protein VFI06_17590 [Chitinophagaceae bacterium]|nr:hypothetical protein [Chitinophagaceae bacterium]
MDENNDHIERRIEKFSLTVQMEPPSPPPPPGFVSPFKILEEWLSYISAEKPEKPIADVQFCLDDLEGRNTLSVYGINRYDVDKDVIAYRDDFKPTHRFFPLPKDEYEHLSQQQLRERVLHELKEFMKTEKFKSSFMGQSESARINFSDASTHKLK